MAVLALVAALFTPLLATSAASAVPGYVGVSNGSPWPDATLGLMTKGKPYSDSVTAPFAWDDRYGNVSAHGDVPPGITVELDAINPAVINVTGTPTTSGPFEFTIEMPGESSAILDFVIDIDAGVPASTTVVASPAVSPYTAVSLSATVTGDSPTGTVEFFLGASSVGTGAVTGGVATYTGAVASSFVGSTWAVTAEYSGDEGNASSVSDPAAVYIYASNTVSGAVSRNGSPVNATVDLLDGDGIVVTTTTAVAGEYALTVTPTTALQAATKYYIRAVDSGAAVYYAASGGAGQANIDATTAELTGPSQWAGPQNLFFNVAPVWTDDSLATARLGSEYEDGVTASGTAVLHYDVSAGTFPAGLDLDENTGAVTGTPTDQSTYTFTIRAYNDYGSVTQDFTITPGDAGVAPTFIDTELATPVIGAAYSQDVAASGDPEIVYSSGTLPAGLELDAETGLITGTPTESGEFTVTITATNEFGEDEYVWSGTISAIPVIDLVLDFQAGTALGEAGSDISASGLKVGSTYTLDLHSDPVRLYTGIVDATGGFTWRVALPANTPVGAHELILTGVAPDGTVMSATAWFTLLADGTIGAVSYSGPLPALAITGSSPALPLGLAALLLVLGVVLVAVRQRRLA